MLTGHVEAVETTRTHRHLVGPSPIDGSVMADGLSSVAWYGSGVPAGTAKDSDSRTIRMLTSGPAMAWVTGGTT